MGPTNRFFSATILGGRLHVRDIPDRGPSDSSHIEYFTESFIDPGLDGWAGDRKVGTTRELEAAIEEPMKVAPTRNVLIHESLEDEGAARKPIHPVGESPTRGVAQLAAVVLSGV